MNKSQRINDMLIFLNKKRQFNLKDIMNRYHISKSTALRDIASLETLGIPIYSDLGRNGSYKILSNDLLSPIIFSIDEISALYFSMLTLENYNMCPFDIDLQKLKEKFENSISEQQLSKITKIEKILQPEVGKTISNSQLRIILDILLHRQEEFFPIKYEQQSLQVRSLNAGGGYAATWICSLVCPGAASWAGLWPRRVLRPCTARCREASTIFSPRTLRRRPMSARWPRGPQWSSSCPC